MREDFAKVLAGASGGSKLPGAGLFALDPSEIMSAMNIASNFEQMKLKELETMADIDYKKQLAEESKHRMKPPSELEQSIQKANLRKLQAEASKGEIELEMISDKVAQITVPGFDGRPTKIPVDLNTYFRWLGTHESTPEALKLWNVLKDDPNWRGRTFGDFFSEFKGGGDSVLDKTRQMYLGLMTKPESERTPYEKNLLEASEALLKIGVGGIDPGTRAEQSKVGAETGKTLALMTDPRSLNEHLEGRISEILSPMESNFTIPEIRKKINRGEELSDSEREIAQNIVISVHDEIKKVLKPGHKVLRDPEDNTFVIVDSNGNVTNRVNPRTYYGGR